MVLSIQVIMRGHKLILGHENWSHGCPDDGIAYDAPSLGALTMVLSLPCLKGEDNPSLGLELAPYNA